MGKIPPLKPSERRRLDAVARWRRTFEEWIICDPSLDEAIKALPFTVRSAIRGGRNVSFAQAQAIAAGEAEKV